MQLVLQLSPINSGNESKALTANAGFLIFRNQSRDVNVLCKSFFKMSCSLPITATTL